MAEKGANNLVTSFMSPSEAVNISLNVVKFRCSVRTVSNTALPPPRICPRQLFFLNYLLIWISSHLFTASVVSTRLLSTTTMCLGMDMWTFTIPRDIRLRDATHAPPG